MSEKLVHVTPSLDTGATSRAERSGCLGTLWGIQVRLLCAARRPGRPLQPENFRSVLTPLNRSAWGSWQRSTADYWKFQSGMLLC